MNIDFNTMALFAIAFMNAVAAVAAWQTRKDAAEIKTHTNSMKDALVEAREEVARLAGLEAGRTEADKSAAERAKGALEAQMTSAVETVIKENGNHKPTAAGEPAKVEVVNKDKPVPVKITAGAVDSITAAVKEATAPHPKSTPKPKPKTKRKARK